MQIPGGDAGVVRVDGHPTKALAFSSDVTPRYCEADPFEGGKQAVAECWRNLTATGALPLAATDNLNFGNPERPEIMGQMVKAIEGIGAGLPRARLPDRLGERVALHETNGQGILPTPTIGGVGLIDDWGKMARIGFAAEARRSSSSARRRPGGHILPSPSTCATCMAGPTARRRGRSRAREEGRRLRARADC